MQLPGRACGFDPNDNQRTDRFVRIEVGGEVLYFDKAKYADAFGIDLADDSLYFVDRILMDLAPAQQAQGRRG